MSDERGGGARFAGAFFAAVVLLSGLGYLSHEWTRLKTALPQPFVAQIDAWAGALGNGPAVAAGETRDQIAAVGHQMDGWVTALSGPGALANTPSAPTPGISDQFNGWLAAFRRTEPVAAPPAEGEGAAAQAQFSRWFDGVSTPIATAAGAQSADMARQLAAWSDALQSQDLIATPTTRVDELPGLISGQFGAWMEAWSRPDPLASASGPEGGQAAALSRQFSSWLLALAAPETPAETQVAEATPSTTVTTDTGAFSAAGSQAPASAGSATSTTQAPAPVSAATTDQQPGTAPSGPGSTTVTTDTGAFSAAGSQAPASAGSATSTTQAPAPVSAATTDQQPGTAPSGPGSTTVASTEAGSPPKPEDQASLASTPPANSDTDSPTAPEPSFIRVQTDGTGDAVLEGQAPAGSSVTVMADGTNVGVATADESGHWLIISEQRMKPGEYKLTLSAEPEGGGETIKGAAFRITVPDTAAAESEAKTGTGNLSDTQKEWQKQVAAVSGSRLVTPPEDSVEPAAPSGSTSDAKTAETAVASAEATAQPVASTSGTESPSASATGAGTATSGSSAAGVQQASASTGTAASGTTGNGGAALAAPASSAETSASGGTTNGSSPSVTPATTAPGGTTDAGASPAPAASPEAVQTAQNAGSSTGQSSKTGGDAAEPPPSKGLLDRAGDMANSVTGAVTDILKNLTGGSEAPETSTAASAAAKGEIYVSAVSVTGAAGSAQTITVSGRGKSGSTLKLNMDGSALGEVTVDDAGRWLLEKLVAIPDGKHSIQAEGVGENGQVVASAGYDFEKVTAAAPGSTPAVIALNPPVTVPAAQQPTLQDKQQVTISSATYRPTGDTGVLTVAGRGLSGGKVDVAVDGEPVGTTPVDTNSRWLMEITRAYNPGRHEIKAELSDGKGIFLSRATQMLEVEAPAVVASAGTGQSTASQTGGAAETAPAPASSGSSSAADTSSSTSGTATPSQTASSAAAAATAAAASSEAQGSSESGQAATGTAKASQSKSTKAAVASGKRTMRQAAQRSRAHKAKVTQHEPRQKKKRVRLAAKSGGKAGSEASAIVRILHGSDLTMHRVRKRTATGYSSRMVPLSYQGGRGWYRVRKGDTLCRIARKHYGKAKLYTLVWKRNKDRIRHPDLIFPGQLLRV